MSVAGTINGTSVTIPTGGDTDNAATFTALLQALVSACSTVFQFGAASGLTTSAVYLRPGIAAADSTEVFLVFPKAGKVSALYCKGTSNASGGSVTVTARIDGADSTLTATVANGAASASDVTHTVSVTAGQTLSVKALGNAGYSSGLANLTASFAFTSS